VVVLVVTVPRSISGGGGSISGSSSMSGGGSVSVGIVVAREVCAMLLSKQTRSLNNLAPTPR